MAPKDTASLPPGVGPYMLQSLVDDLPLNTKENKSVRITCVEAWEGNIYIGTSSHEIIHLVIIPSQRGTPGTTFKTEKLNVILASRRQISAGQSAASASGAYIQQILLLPRQMKALLLSSTGYLTFYTLPELGSAYEGTVKVNGIKFMVLDSTDEDDDQGPVNNQGDVPGKQVMLCGKKSVRIIKVGADARLVRSIEFPGTIHGARQGPIACVATESEYALLHIENSGKIDLPPIVSEQFVPESPAIPEPEPEQEPKPEPEPARTASPAFPITKSKSPSPSPGPSPAKHPPRQSSLPRPRSGDFTTRLNNAASGKSSPQRHMRATSTGSMQPPPKDSNISGRLSPQARKQLPRSASPRNLVPPNNGNSLLVPVPGSPPATKAPSPLSSELAPPMPPSTTTRSPAPSPSSTPPPPPPPPSRRPSNTASSKPTPVKPRPKEKVILKPHIVTPAPEEFLITTGTGSDDPGVGVFFNTNGDPTPRGIINFKRYPEKLLLDKGGWLIALLGKRDKDGVTIEVFHFEQEDEERGKITIPVESLKGTVGIHNAHANMQYMVEDIGRRLMFVRLNLNCDGDEESPPDWELSRNEEELQAARRMSMVESSILVWDDSKLWGLIQRPIIAILDEGFPKIDSLKGKDGHNFIAQTLAVLKRITGDHPQTELFIRQKASMLLMSALITSDLPPDLARSRTIEGILLDSGLDPRIFVALFPSYRKEVIEGEFGLWAYSGIETIYDELYKYESTVDLTQIENRIEAKFILKNYLTVWRNRKGFGSVVDDKEVFSTVDATLLVVLLDIGALHLDHTAQCYAQLQVTAKREIFSLLDSGLDCFDRAVEILEERKKLYLLSWLYQTKKMSTEVLATWRRIVESEEGDEDFEGGEDRIKEYLVARRNKDVVLEYAVWLAKRNARNGIQVFLDPRSKIKWNPREVLEVLKSDVPDAYKLYLEHLVVELKAVEFSNELIFVYLDELISVVQETPEIAETLKASYEAYQALSLPKPTYRRFITENSLGDKWWLNRIHFLELLGEESGYDAEEVQKKIQPWESAFVPEIIILCGRQSKHAEALRLLCHGLKDFDTAINYCLFGGMSIFKTKQKPASRSEQGALFAILLVELLKLDDFDERLEQTSSLLSRFGSWLDVHQVLSVIPDSWSVELLSEFLTKALRKLLREKNETVIARSLSRSLNNKVAYEFVQLCEAAGPTIQV